MSAAAGAAPQGRLVVVSGPGGVGKGTVVQALLARRDDVVVSVSATTRPPRPGEVDGRDYHFLSDADFDRLLDEGGFLEWAEFNGHRYGTPLRSVRGALAEGRTVLLEIDVQGARQVRDSRPEALLVFLTPPSREALRERLRRRGADDDDAIARRMAIADWELGQAGEFDHVLVNADVEQAAEALSRILGPAPVA